MNFSCASAIVKLAPTSMASSTSLTSTQIQDRQARVPCQDWRLIFSIFKGKRIFNDKWEHSSHLYFKDDREAFDWHVNPVGIFQYGGSDIDVSKWHESSTPLWPPIGVVIFRTGRLWESDLYVDYCLSFPFLEALNLVNISKWTFSNKLSLTNA